MQRAVITVRGRVQKVGYRDFATEIADTMDITGIAENLPDGKSVRIVAEAEKNVLDEYIELLWAKEDPMIRVLDINVAFEPATGEYGFFDIVYGDFQQEAFERIGVAAIYLKRLDVGQNKILEKQEQTIAEIHGLDTSISSFHHDTVQRFDILDAKYGWIAENMERAIDAINRTCDNTERDRKDFQDAIEKLANAIIESRRT